MATTPLYFKLVTDHRVRLSPPPTERTRTRSRALVDAFMEKYTSVDDRFTWTSPRAESELVVHQEDRSLRVDFQNPFNDPSTPGVPWANFQLQGGADSFACVLLQMGPGYHAADVRAAWLASLQHTRNARMEWRFVANAIEEAVLWALDLKPRTMQDLWVQFRDRGGGGWLPAVRGIEAHHGYLTTTRIPESLLQLSLAKLARKEGSGWVLTGLGMDYRNQRAQQGSPGRSR